MNLSSANSDHEPLKWPRIWFRSLAAFHHVAEPVTWKFDNDKVIAFLRSCRDSGMPTRKRLKIVESLIVYRNRVRRASEPRMETLAAKLREMVNQERLSRI